MEHSLTEAGDKDPLPVPPLQSVKLRTRKDWNLPKVIQPVAETLAVLNFLYFWRIQYYKASINFIKEYRSRKERCLYLDILNK